jgi:hypothetical protein
LANLADAAKFSVTGGGAETHIGNGLALPIQAAVTVMGTVFPPLLIPFNPAAGLVTGTLVKPHLSVGGKQGYQRKLVVPAGVLVKPGGQKTVGVHFSNPTVFAVGTNIAYKWPAAPAVFSSGAVGPMTVAGFGGTMTYTNKLGTRFGGAAQFAITPGSEPAGLITPSIVTVYAKINAVPTGTPPCKHPALGGANGACVAGILLAKPTGIGAIGGATGMTVMTPGGPVPGKNVAAMNMVKVPVSGSLAGPPPVGAVLVATGAIPTNMAASQPGPWTTGQIVISNPAAKGGGEKFTIEGKDARTANGGGTIQMVAGSLSTRLTSGPNANRGWLRLQLTPNAAVPSMSWLGLSATVGLLVLTFGYTMRRRIFAQE